MARIEELLNKIKTAVYGADVRDSIHDGIQQCYDDVTTAKTKAEDATTKALDAKKYNDIKTQIFCDKKYRLFIKI